MTGKIIFYNSDTQMGMIRAEDGKRYNFIAAEIRNAQNVIMQGSEVDFVLGDQDTPLDIYITAQMAVQTVNNTDFNLETIAEPKKNGKKTALYIGLGLVAAIVIPFIVVAVSVFNEVSKTVDTVYKLSGGH